MRVDLALYGISAVFAGVTALTSSLAPHRAWGAIAWVGYAVATILALLPAAAGMGSANVLLD